MFYRAHNTSVATNSEPCLCLRVDLKSFEEQIDDWEQRQNVSIITQIRTVSSQEAKPSRLHGMFNQVCILVTLCYMMQNSLNRWEKPLIWFRKF